MFPCYTKSTFKVQKDNVVGEIEMGFVLLGFRFSLFFFFIGCEQYTRKEYYKQWYYFCWVDLKEFYGISYYYMIPPKQKEKKREGT